jgi:hypothetical protein
MPRNVWALALEQELEGIEPEDGRGYRAILTTDGLVTVFVTDRLTEVVIDLHRSVLDLALTGWPSVDLGEFEGCEVDGHQLAFKLEQIPTPTSISIDEKV